VSPPRQPATDRSAALSRETIARAALALLDAEGLDALSMRRLASDLGVGTMTLYGYVRSKRELLAAVVDVAAEDFVAPPATGDLRARATAFLRAVSDWLERHPALVALRDEEPIVRPSAFSVSEHGMRILLDMGLGPEEAARAFRLLFTYVFGHAAFSPRAPTPDEQRALHAALLSLPEDEFPAMRTAAAGAGAALGGEAQFRYGLERILDGIEARAAQLRRDR
jgi:AcrR family transcriptional regulator